MLALLGRSLFKLHPANARFLKSVSPLHARSLRLLSLQPLFSSTTHHLPHPARTFSRAPCLDLSTAAMNIDVAGMRETYEGETFRVDTLPDNPVEQFEKWLKAAVDAQEYEPNAMTLATCTKDGVPNARMVLLKGFGNDGFRLFTNYESQKGSELNENPLATLVFWWRNTHRSVRIHGRVSKLPEDVSDAYFHSRPLGSRVGAAVSRQSQVLESREAFEAQFKAALADAEAKDAAQENADGEHKDAGEHPIERPPYWGGYIVEPEWIEFWQGQRSRLHDRIRYRKVGQNDDGTPRFVKERLSP